MCAIISTALLIAAAMSNPKPDANYVLLASALFAMASSFGAVASEIGKLVKTNKKED